jgi:presenilin-like A22 family membrane protease
MLKMLGLHLHCQFFKNVFLVILEQMRFAFKTGKFNMKCRRSNMQVQFDLICTPSILSISDQFNAKSNLVYSYNKRILLMGNNIS